VNIPSFLPSPDQSVGRFSLFSRTGTGGVKGVKRVNLLLGTVVSTLAALTLINYIICKEC